MKSTKLLLVEDHHIMRRGLASLLTTECDVEIWGEAASGEEAISLLNENSLPDMIIMDVSLPEMNGIETTHAIKSRYPQVKILILSMYNNPTLLHQALQAGASGYILKKSMVEELNAALEQVAQGRQFISPMITASLDPDLQFMPDSLQKLTHREIEVFERLSTGSSVKDIAEELVISIYTVYTHMNTIKRKMGIEKNQDLVRYAIENPLIVKTSEWNKHI
jgi:two-component system, NarL family, response regulator NreC